jgi:hypothetical protein
MELLILLASCPQTCMKYTIDVCTVKNLRWRTEELSETCRVSFQNEIEKLVHLVGFIIWNLSQCTVTWMLNTTIFSLSLSLTLSPPPPHYMLWGNQSIDICVKENTDV